LALAGLCVTGISSQEYSWVWYAIMRV